jgi:hypothetical protein
MLSSHDTLMKHTYAHTHFPQQNPIVVPPENGWNMSQDGHYIINTDIRDFKKGIINIPQYDTPGILVIHCNYDLWNQFKNIKFKYIIKGPFSREDIALILTCLYLKKPNRFIPQQVGLRFSDTGLAANKLGKGQHWVTPKMSEFISTDTNPLPHPGEKISHTMDSWRWHLENRIKRDFDPNMVDIFSNEDSQGHISPPSFLPSS